MNKFNFRRFRYLWSLGHKHRNHCCGATFVKWQLFMADLKREESRAVCIGFVQWQSIMLTERHNPQGKCNWSNKPRPAQNKMLLLLLILSLAFINLGRVVAWGEKAGCSGGRQFSDRNNVYWQSFPCFWMGMDFIFVAAQWRIFVRWKWLTLARMDRQGR